MLFIQRNRGEMINTNTQHLAAQQSATTQCQNSDYSSMNYPTSQGTYPQPNQGTGYQIADTQTYTQPYQPHAPACPYCRCPYCGRGPYQYYPYQYYPYYLPYQYTVCGVSGAYGGAYGSGSLITQTDGGSGFQAYNDSAV
jgi:hypothetical protein